MALIDFTDNVEIIQELGTFPNQDDGLSADALKAKFDEAAKLIKAFINEWIVPQHNNLEQRVYDDYATCIQQYEELVDKIGALQQAVEANQLAADQAVSQLKELLQSADAQLLEDLNALSGVVEENKDAAVLANEQLRDDLSYIIHMETTERKAADEELLLTAKEYAYLESQAVLGEMYTSVEALRLTMQKNDNALSEADRVAAERLDALEAGYRHINTFTNNTGESVPSLEINRDFEGQPFSCSDFLIFATFPPIPSNAVGQLYIGPPRWSWIAYENNAMTASTTRQWRIHLWHCHDGLWCYDGVYSDNTLLKMATSGVRGNIFSENTVGEKLSELYFYANTSAPSYFPNGTTFEIYGK